MGNNGFKMPHQNRDYKNLVIVCPPSKIYVIPMTMHDNVNNTTRLLRVNVTFTIFKALFTITTYNSPHKQVHLVFNLL